MGVKPEELEKAMNDEIDKVKKSGITNEEYEKLENQAENDFVQQNQKILGVVTNLATYYTFQNDANLINTEIERYKKVTKEDIKRVANKYLTKGNSLVVYYLPKSDEGKTDGKESKSPDKPVKKAPQKKN
jgi:predicted Zn-dependent peptidase